MTTHTPGPWTNRHWNQHGSVRISSPNFSEPEMIAVYPRRDQYGFVIESSIDEAEANARLVAAAPELIDVCESFLEIVDNSHGVAGFHLNGNVAEWDEFNDVVSLARAVVAKVHPIPGTNGDQS